MSGKKKISVIPDGPYCVRGDIPLVCKDQVMSAHREPLAWQTGEELRAEGTYSLCRCGQSGDKPFCDGNHTRRGFDGAAAVDKRPTAKRQVEYPGSTTITVKYDSYLCSNAGFCGNRSTSVAQLMWSADDVNIRTQIMAMIDRCPSGSLVYALDKDGPDLEPDLPEQIAATTEACPHGRVDGPLWVTGGIPVECENGDTLEIRNRVTLCSCGRSKHKPLCDGSHRVPGPDGDDT